jgi:phosphoribosyl-dephospho-CoA transferase
LVCCCYVGFRHECGAHETARDIEIVERVFMNEALSQKYTLYVKTSCWALCSKDAARCARADARQILAALQQYCSNIPAAFRRYSISIIEQYSGAQ